MKTDQDQSLALHFEENVDNLEEIIKGIKYVDDRMALMRPKQQNGFIDFLISKIQPQTNTIDSTKMTYFTKSSITIRQQPVYNSMGCTPSEDKYQKQQREPLNFQKSAKKFLEDFVRLVNFFLMSCWLVSFFLAKNDTSEEIDIILDETSTTFRNHLWWNGCVTLTLAVIFYFFNISLTKLGTGENQTMSKHRKYLFYAAVMTVLLILMIFSKIGHFMYELFQYLIQIDYYNRSQFVLVYSFAEIVIFCSFGAYYLININLVYLWKVDIANDFKTVYQSSPFQLSRNSKQFSITQQVFNFNFQQFTSSASKYLTWIFVPNYWFLFILVVIKELNDSEQLKMKTPQNLMHWIVFDVILSLLIFTLLVGFVFGLKKSNSYVYLARQESNIQLCIKILQKYMTSQYATILVILIIGKTLWVLVGILVLYLNENFRSTSSTYLFLVLVGYFTVTLFFVIKAYFLCLKGYKRGEFMIQQSNSRNQRKLYEKKTKSIKGAGNGGTSNVINIAFRNLHDCLVVVCLGLQK